MKSSSTLNALFSTELKCARNVFTYIWMCYYVFAILLNIFIDYLRFIDTVFNLSYLCFWRLIVSGKRIKCTRKIQGLLRYTFYLNKPNLFFYLKHLPTLGLPAEIFFWAAERTFFLAFIYLFQKTEDKNGIPCNQDKSESYGTADQEHVTSFQSISDSHNNSEVVRNGICGFSNDAIVDSTTKHREGSHRPGKLFHCFVQCFLYH